METGKISSLQMMMLLYPTIVATSILDVPSITAKYAKHDLWMSPILASVIGFITVYIAVKLNKLYPDLTIIQISEEIIGRYVGKVIGGLFLFFYVQTTGTIVRSYGEFIVGSFLFNTPISVIMVSMVVLCAFAVYGGLEVLGRITQLLFPLFTLPLILLIIFLSPEFDFLNIFPILEDGIMPPVKGAIVPAGWFTEFFLIAFLLPFLVDREKGMKYGMVSVLIVMITLVLVNLIVLFVFGTTTASKVYPLMDVSRYISVADFFENLESVTMAVWIGGAFVKTAVFYYAAAIGTAQLLNLKDYRSVIWPIGILIIEFSFWSVNSSMDLESYLNRTFPLYAFIIQTSIPLFLLVLATIRKRKSAFHS
ncbi:spore germination protein KB [Oikeobacillus pervagus]|uniref:Spore germination protein KB n=1 Tax=Oikeobacillus pervagus TaxID=1325931 RepID=A0AAJ1T300_9BACI|nr:endospore germination permease [Oikeobacillus pervagus]MDQ0216252.1 spore germination protein KB [Oikeobacillus pervagus]